MESFKSENLSEIEKDIAADGPARKRTKKNLESPDAQFEGGEHEEFQE